MNGAGMPLKGWKLWIYWVLATIAGFSLGIGLSYLSLNFLSETAAMVGFGVLMGLLQWLVLRRFFPATGWWILAGMIGSLLGIIATNLVHKPLLFNMSIIVEIGLGLASMGLVIGIAQAFVLRNHLRTVGYWVFASTLGWPLGGLSIWLFILSGVELAGIFKVVSEYALIGLIVGAVTGLVLVLLLRQSLPAPGNNSSLGGLLALSGGTLILFLILNFWPVPAFDQISLTEMPELGTPKACGQMPPLECTGGKVFCTEIVPFEPVEGSGYINYPENGETWDDQYRSYLRRDLMMVIQYASARIACETADWQYREFEPIGMGDMSEQTGAIPGTSKGAPGHPPETHTNGSDIDIAYFQSVSSTRTLTSGDEEKTIQGNLLGFICRHTLFGMEEFHCTQTPQLLDPWRTALMIYYVAQHPGVRVIGVDGQVGLVLENAFDQLVQAGWIDPDLRAQIPLAYEVTDEGWGWFLNHHHHLHISMYE